MKINKAEIRQMLHFDSLISEGLKMKKSLMHLLGIT